MVLNFEWSLWSAWSITTHNSQMGITTAVLLCRHPSEDAAAFQHNCTTTWSTCVALQDFSWTMSWTQPILRSRGSAWYHYAIQIQGRNYASSWQCWRPSRCSSTMKWPCALTTRRHRAVCTFDVCANQTLARSHVTWLQQLTTQQDRRRPTEWRDCHPYNGVFWILLLSAWTARSDRRQWNRWLTTRSARHIDASVISSWKFLKHSGIYISAAILDAILNN